MLRGGTWRWRVFPSWRGSDRSPAIWQFRRIPLQGDGSVELVGDPSTAVVLRLARRTILAQDDNSSPYSTLLSGGGLAKGYGELGLAAFGGIKEGVAGALAFGGFEEESLFDAVGEAGEAGFAVDICADFEIEFARAGESVGYVDFDSGGVDGLVIGVGDGEIGGALSDGGVDRGDGVGVGGLGEGGGEKQG